MFELRNSDEVWYKSEEMYDWIHYGNLIILMRDIENDCIFEIKKFDFDKEQYVLCEDFTEYEYGGKMYPVVNGKFEIDIPVLPEPEPTETEIIQAEILLNQAEMINRQMEMDETLAAILLNQMGE